MFYGQNVVGRFNKDSVRQVVGAYQQGQRTLSAQFDKDLRQVLFAPTSHPPPHRAAVLVGHLLK
jgi:hypothetical protein